MKKVLSALIVFLILISTVVLPVSAEGSYHKGLIGEGTSLSDSADAYGNVIQALNTDDEVFLCNVFGDYCEVLTFDGEGNVVKGYCPAANVKLLYNGATNNTANIRSEPTSNSELLGMFLADTTLTVYGDAVNGWYEVEGVCSAGNTVRGYCFGGYIVVLDAIYDEPSSFENSGATPDVSFDPKDPTLLGSDMITDSIQGTSGEKWYKINIRVGGDATLSLLNTQALDCVWEYNLFTEYGDTVQQGTSELSGKYRCSFDSLDAGTYYLRVAISQCDAPDYVQNLYYEISFTTVSDVNIPQDDDSKWLYETADEALFVLGGQIFYKSADGKAALGIGCGEDEINYVILVSDTKEAAEMYSLNEYEYIEKGSLEYNGEEHYYSLIYYDNVVETISDGLYRCNNGNSTRFVEDDAYELLNLYYGEKASKGRYNIIRRFQKGDTLLLLGCFAGIVVILIILFFILRAWFRRVRRGRRRYY